MQRSGEDVRKDRSLAASALIGLSGPLLTPVELKMLRFHPPAGVILFKRNIETPGQLTALTGSVRDACRQDITIMIDQEGGRVARMRPPCWTAHPPASAVGRLHDISDMAATRAAWITGALIGHECKIIGIDVVCAPVLDRLVGGADPIVGDRAYGADPRMIAALGRAMADGLLAAGVQPVGKHAPGHGQANCDSHAGLPIVARQTEDDLAPFRALADLPWMMTAHILFPQWDTIHPATQSPKIIHDVIRTSIGFDGVLVSDDLAMGALAGDPGARARAALGAGCDLALYCAGDPEGNRAMLESCPPITDQTRSRLDRARAMAAAARQELDMAALAHERSELLRGIW